MTTAGEPGPALLAQGARRALQPSAGWGPAWPRAAAFLARQALEDAVDRVWHESATGMRDCSAAAQLVSLPFYLDDPDLAKGVRQCWCSLSSACHAHPYELAPTVSELEGWLDVVDELVAAVGSQP
jgi:hypothetical protein